MKFKLMSRGIFYQEYAINWATRTPSSLCHGVCLFLLADFRQEHPRRLSTQLNSPLRLHLPTAGLSTQTLKEVRAFLKIRKHIAPSKDSSATLLPEIKDEVNESLLQAKKLYSLAEIKITTLAGGQETR